MPTGSAVGAEHGGRKHSPHLDNPRRSKGWSKVFAWYVDIVNRCRAMATAACSGAGSHGRDIQSADSRRGYCENQ